jgi:16S rRNA (uracil1498-N3)-methyltransferase
MSAPPRFYVDDLPAAGESLSLDPSETRHAVGVRRLQPGDAVELLNGRGGVAQARIAKAASRTRGCVVRIEHRAIVAPPPLSVHLAAAVPKGDRQAVLLDMATQLGMSMYTPLRCERSVTPVSTAALKRWRRVVIQACKQSGRAYLPAINTVSDPVAVAANMAPGEWLWVADPHGTPAAELDPQLRPTSGRINALVGPEGGFTAAELGTLDDHGAIRVRLSPAILRVEAAAIALLAQLDGVQSRIAG